MAACLVLAHLSVLLGGALPAPCWAFAALPLLWPAWHHAVGPVSARVGTGFAVGSVAVAGAVYLLGAQNEAMVTACVGLMGVLAARQASRALPSHDLQALVLALLLTCAGAMLNPTPSYALTLLPFAGCGVFALLTRQLCFDLAMAALARGEGAHATAQLARTDVVTPRFLLGVTALTFGILGVAGVTFAAFPRVGLPAFGGAGAHGLPDQVTLGAGAWTYADNTVAARLFGLRRQDFDAGLYLRGRSYDQLSAAGFASAGGLRPSRPLAGTGPQLRYAVVQNAAEGDPLLTLGPVHGGTVSTSDNNEAQLPVSSSGELPFAAPASGSQRARLVGTATASAAALPTTPIPAEAASAGGPVDHDVVFRAYYTALPPQLRRGLTPLLHEALDKRLATGPAAQADAIRRYLAAHYAYDEAEPAPDDATGDATNFAREEGEGPLLAFARHGRRGNCTYFAATYAALLRLAGVPSRVVGGYAGGRWEAEGGVAVFTGSHAHAWVEWYVPGLGWVTDDATPGRVPEVLGDWAGLRERLGRFWQLQVLQYNLGSQLDLLREARSGFNALKARVSPLAAREDGDGRMRHAGVVTLLAVAVAVAASLVALPLARRLAGRRRRRLGDLLQAALERHLQRPLRPDETLRQAAAQLGEPVPAAVRALFATAVAVHEATRYGRKAAPPSQAQLLRALRDEAPGRG